MEVGSVSNTTPPAQTDRNAMGNEVFMKLLVAQLRAQNPLEPLNPEQFVTQLVQFNTLDQIIQIRKALETSGDSPAGAAPTDAPASSESE